jgi:uncharacterized membrane protein
MAYSVFKALHLFGVILFIGNIIVTALWKSLADRSGDARIIAFAQRLVTVTDFVFTTGGVVFLVIGAYGMIAVAGLDPMHTTWLLWGQGLLIASGIIWVVALIPTQIAQVRLARGFAGGGPTGALLATQPALAGVGDHRHPGAAGESVCDGVQALSFQGAPRIVGITLQVPLRGT